MRGRARIIRGANFAYPYSERGDYYSPRTVRLLIGVSALAVLALVALPFYLEFLEQRVLSDRGVVALEASAVEQQLEEVAPILVRKAFLDSLKAVLGARVQLRQRISGADYRMDRLLLHLSEIIPDGVVLTGISMEPPEQRRAGRPAQDQQAKELPDELQQAYRLILQGTARNAAILQQYFDALQASPLLYAPNRTTQILENNIQFTITCHLPGSGVQIEEAGR